jgi:nitrite reductase/ring-hydroxylating ferredoxin subunit
MAASVETTSETTRRWIPAASLAELESKGRLTAHVGDHVIVLFHTGGKVFAVDNRCPHMGFPLDRGTVKDCILTCHWHHARFDLNTGGTFDQWADDVRAFPIKIEADQVLVDVSAPRDRRSHHLARLRDGLERDISLVIAKSILPLASDQRDSVEAFRIALEFGARNRAAGCGGGLTTLVCLANLSKHLDPSDRPRAMFHGISEVASDCAGQAPRFPVRPLPGGATDSAQLKRWFRQFIEVRDSEGVERCIASAVRDGCDRAAIADMLFAAATDHRYLTIGHALDFTNKAIEALDLAGWDLAEPVLTSLAPVLSSGERMEERNSWRSPIDLVQILERAFEALPAALETGGKLARIQPRRANLLPILVGDDPEAIATALLTSIRQGTPADLAGVVVYAAALRIAHFPTSNEFGDWDTAHHSFTFANAVHRGLMRVESPELVRAIFDAAMSVYLNRFLNVPAAKIPELRSNGHRASDMLNDLPAMFDQQQQVNPVASLVAAYFSASTDPAPLQAVLGKMLLREDRDFHSIQSMEAAYPIAISSGDPIIANHFMIATARYLAAHAPTVRAQGQTFRIAERLHRGEPLFDEE